MKSKPFKKITLLLVLFIVQALASSISLAKEKESLVFSIDIIRHGNRTPCADNIKTQPYTWSEGLGELTPLGMRQEYELGKKFRDRYIASNHLLSDSYSVGMIYIRSTDYDRTLMSAESLLTGLYPHGTGPRLSLNETNQSALPNAYQPIPIHTIPQDQDTLLNPSRDYNYEELLENNIYSTPEWKKRVSETEPYLSNWSKATGINLTNINQLVPLADTLFVRQANNIPLPAALTSDDIQKIIETANWESTTIYKNKTIATAAGRELLQNIAAYLQEASQQATSLKYVLYSAHDHTILMAAGALGGPLDKMPPYASDLNISLFDQGNKNYRVVVTYNDQPFILPSTGTNSCSLDQFLQLTQ